MGNQSGMDPFPNIPISPISASEGARDLILGAKCAQLASLFVSVMQL